MISAQRTKELGKNEECKTDLERLRAELLDSSIDSEEFAQEIRDKVRSEPLIELDPNEEFTNTDMKYYKIMEPMEKLMTINNRTKEMGTRAKELESQLAKLRLMTADVGVA